MYKKPKKTKKPKKNQKTPKNHWAGFFPTLILSYLSMKGAMRRLRTKSVAAKRTPGRSFFRKDPMPATRYSCTLTLRAK
jgi:hypothetical protein